MKDIASSSSLHLSYTSLSVRSSLDTGRVEENKRKVEQHLIDTEKYHESVTVYCASATGMSAISRD